MTKPLPSALCGRPCDDGKPCARKPKHYGPCSSGQARDVRASGPEVHASEGVLDAVSARLEALGAAWDVSPARPLHARVRIALRVHQGGSDPDASPAASLEVIVRGRSLPDAYETLRGIVASLAVPLGAPL